LLLFFIFYFNSSIFNKSNSYNTYFLNNYYKIKKVILHNRLKLNDDIIIKYILDIFGLCVFFLVWCVFCTYASAWKVGRTVWRYDEGWSSYSGTYWRLERGVWRYM